MTVYDLIFYATAMYVGGFVLATGFFSVAIIRVVEALANKNEQQEN